MPRSHGSKGAQQAATPPTPQRESTPSQDDLAGALNIVLQAIRDGRLVVRDEDTDGGSRSRAHPLPAPRGDEIPSELARHLQRVPEPRRQRKQRSMPPRKFYRVAPMTADRLKEMQQVTPAATQILVYLAGHPGSSVNDLAANLDLRRKTVENLLSMLHQKSLIQSSPKP